jgi:hypothetical protein
MPDISQSSWAESDAGNTATPPNGWPENQAPSTVNDCARMMMGAIKRFWTRVNPVAASGGAANAYTLTPGVALPAYVTGEVYSFRANHANTGAATLNISGLGAKAIKRYASGAKADLAAGELQSGQPVQVCYDGTDMVLHSPSGAGALSSSELTTTLNATTLQQGVHSLYLVSGKPNATNGPAIHATESATHKVPIAGYGFDSAVEETMWFEALLPKSYNGGTIACRPFWGAAAGTAGQGVAWGFSARLYGDGEDWDQAPGSEVVVTDTLTNLNKEQIGAASGALTPAGTLSGAPKRLRLKVARKVANAADTLAADAILEGVLILFTISAKDDA